jgi:6-phosphofructokinase 1
MRKLAVMTSGGDAPGMNAFIRSTVRQSIRKDILIYGVRNGYRGLIDGQIYPMNYDSVCNIIQKGGTMLKTSRCPEFETVEGRSKAAKQLMELEIEGLICCGGNGSYAGLKDFGHPKTGQWRGQVIGAPGTIDNDIESTDFTIGFDTAVNTAVEAIDKLRDTSDSHSTSFLVEVMGRKCGDIALAAGKATGAAAVLIPEEKTDIEKVQDSFRKKGHDIIIVAEGDDTGGAVELAKKLESETGPKIRVCVLGHIQRGGRPTARDRILARDMAHFAVQAFIDGATMKAVAIQKGDLVLVDL